MTSLKTGKGFFKTNWGYMPEYTSNLVARTIRADCAEYVVIDIPSPDNSDIKWRILVDEPGNLSFVYSDDDGASWTTKAKFTPNGAMCATNTPFAP